MKRKLLFLIFSASMISISSFSQDYVFKVLANKGENTYKTASGSSWEPLKTGTKLQSGDVIKTTGNCYLALLSASGKPIELKEAKEYNVNDLKAQVGGSDDGIVSKYADFVMSKMSTEAREENRKKYASITGATERGSFQQIKFFMPTSANIYNSVAIIRWDPQDGAETYQIVLKDWFDEVLMVAETKDSFFKVDFNDSRLEGMEMVIVNVSIKGDKDSNSGDYAIQRVNESEAKEYTVELNDLKSSLDANSSISNLIMAEFYEQNDLLLDALTSYEYAINQSPDVEYFKEAYQEFLMRNGFSDKID
ncbi:MAG: hypothetical protein IIB82_00705 [Bacteroidetes bacterium]|nr:hypothetical protein [Bacteroidota bacterium]